VAAFLLRTLQDNRPGRLGVEPACHLRRFCRDYRRLARRRGRNVCASL